VNVENMDNARQETSRNLKSKKWEYLKDKIHELETNRKNKKYYRCVQAHK
jgi:hypothetical protein